MLWNRVARTPRSVFQFNKAGTRLAFTSSSTKKEWKESEHLERAENESYYSQIARAVCSEPRETSCDLYGRACCNETE